MRFIYAKFIGYIGFYNGLGLNELEIDFSKCRNKITVISGPNGVGKSTLINALSLLPDSNDKFVPSMNAMKILKLTNGINLYEIVFNHPLDKHGNRAITKISIMKDGLELNPNGNVSSYKEIIFSEFNLDSNYIALSQISGNNRGLADKKPAERKKVISSIISSLEVYNDIYKKLNKKSNYYKSYINNLSSKISSIGDEQNLNTSLASLTKKIDFLNIQIDETKREITHLQTIVSMNDPDGSMQNKYNELESQVNISREEENKLYKKLSRYSDIEFDKLDEEIDRYQKVLQNEEANKSSEESMTLYLLKDITKLQSEISELQIKIENLSKEIDPELIQKLSKYSQIQKSIEDNFSGLGISSIEDISKNEIDIFINVISDILDQIDYLYQNTDVDSMDTLSSYYKINEINKSSIDEVIKDGESNKKINKEALSKQREKLFELNHKYNIAKSIKNRPKGCKDNTCIFILDSINILKEYDGNIENLESEINKCESTIEEYQNTIKDFSDGIDRLRKTKSALNIVYQIRNTIKSNISVLSKFSVCNIILDEDKFITLLENRYSFYELKNLDDYRDISNELIQYKSTEKIISELNSKKDIQSGKQEILDNYQSQYDEKIKSIESKKSERDKLKFSIDHRNALITQAQDKIEYNKEIKFIYDEWNNKKNERINIENIFNDLKSKFESSHNYINKISDLQIELKNLQMSLKPMMDQQKSIEANLNMLKSFMTEYNEYSDKYNFINTLKMYSSPTKGGIQSLFMSLYMDKTLTLVNQLLSMIFNGQYRILDYAINEDEFRIPFIGNGMMVDDISNGSTSQVCIMGMIINLVLYTMGSSDYGIVSLDEIDGGLDHQNRYLFVDILQKICDILNIDQLFIISHSVESALSNVDVVLFSNNQDYIDQFQSSNIIFRL